MHIMFIGWLKEYFDYLKNTYTHQEVINYTNDAIEDLKIRRIDCINTLEEAKIDYAQQIGYCPKCSNEMHYHTWIENRGEYQGFPVEERMGEMICEECGYTY